MSLSMLVKTNWSISRTQEPKWLLPRPTKTTSLQNSLQLIIMNGGRPTLLFIKEVKYKWRESQKKVKLQLDDVKKTSTGVLLLVLSCTWTPLGFYIWNGDFLARSCHGRELQIWGQFSKNCSTGDEVWSGEQGDWRCGEDCNWVTEYWNDEVDDGQHDAALGDDEDSDDMLVMKYLNMHLSQLEVRLIAAPLAGSRKREEYWRNLPNIGVKFQYKGKSTRIETIHTWWEYWQHFNLMILLWLLTKHLLKSEQSVFGDLGLC